jgi:putative membrane protein
VIARDAPVGPYHRDFNDTLGRGEMLRSPYRQYGTVRVIGSTCSGFRKRRSTMTRLFPKHPGAAMAAGAIGGLIGGWFKLGWEVTWPPRALDRIPEPQVLVSMFTHVQTPGWISLVIHFTFSILSGVAYGALIEYFPIIALGAGVAFGLAIWVGAHEIVMPLMGLTPPTWQLPASEQGSEFFGHVLWGLVIGVFTAYFRRRFVRSEALPIRGSGAVTVTTAESVAVY